MAPSILRSSLTVVFMAAQVPTGADAHAYLMEPVSRQYSMTRAFHHPDDNVPRYEVCPSCYNSRGADDTRDRAIRLTDPKVLAAYGDGNFPLTISYENGESHPNGDYNEPEEISVRHGICGDPRQVNGDDSKEDENRNWYGTPNKDWPVLTEYKQGGEMKVRMVIGGFHYGHFEFLVCNADDLDNPDGVVTQKCFNMYPLTRSSGDTDGSPVDPEFPGRFYIEPKCRENETNQTMVRGSPRGYVNNGVYRLPPDLTCEHCILQMNYYTGHTCKHVGYDEFNPSWPGTCAPEKSSWINIDSPLCGANKWAYPQQFISCADFSIVADPSKSKNTPPEEREGKTGSSVTPTDMPVVSETSESVGDVVRMEGCSEPYLPYEECDLSESSCCVDGYECTARSPTYSQCYKACGFEGDQCGGSQWEGPTCCWPGFECVVESKAYSKCVGEMAS